jgi:hypothetical protein
MKWGKQKIKVKYFFANASHRFNELDRSRDALYFGSGKAVHFYQLAHQKERITV